ncbi:hypothetical protein GQ44DRAFT_701769 [Phaeosphaeriaceae sp. PMI808]|nr:hypothetical protein GQ44DRAFT_701769 [Phaeosphaeriaceae sp. PMI808]
MASWKIIPAESDDTNIKYVPLLQSRKYYAADDSGSTSGSIARQQKAFVDAFRKKYANPHDSISLWGSTCDTPTDKFDEVKWRSIHGGTEPSTILKCQSALEAVRTSDVWFLLTDGEMWDSAVHQLTNLALAHNVLDVPMIFVITGSRGATPSTTNISVGISFFASSQDTLILFKETGTGNIYVIAGKGCFAALSRSAAARELGRWDDLLFFKDELALFAYCNKVEVHVVKAESRTGSPKGVCLGPEWEERQQGPVCVDLDLLTEAGLLSDDDISDLLADEAFNTLAVAYKTRNRVAEIRAFVQRQRIEQIPAKLEDISGAGAIIARMSTAQITDTERKELQGLLRAAHAHNRERYQSSNAEFENSEEGRRTKKRNQLVDAALRTLASIEAAGFSAEILSRKSNRARRADVVASIPSIEMSKLDLDAPAYKGFCLVCCGEEEVMSICFKEPKPDQVEVNTTDFALNFPLAAGASNKNVELISSQNVCFQCAILAPGGMSIYKEPLTAIIPAVQYDGSNKKYINDQLYLALTAKLATGAAGIAQLFMAILQELMRTRSWAGAFMDVAGLGADEQHEVLQRHRTFQWMLDQLTQNTRTRENFKETGEWVTYPEALSWAAKDFESNGLASFAVTYPAAGFINLLDVGIRTKVFSKELLCRLKSAKVIHSIASKYLAELQVALQGDGCRKWRQKYLRTIYQDFNSDLVPKDQGVASLVTDGETFVERLNDCISGVNLDHDEVTMRKVQLILFWLLFKQKGHCTAQTFFSHLRVTEPLATTILDPTLPIPSSEHSNILLSIFAHQDAHLINPELAAQHTTPIPFANPFGASVLHCGSPQCNQVFCTLTKPEQVNDKTVNAIRDARTKHLINVYGIATRFETSSTGLPARTETGRPPTSTHISLHIGIAREWAAHTHEQRRAIVDDEGAREAFVACVQARLCADGRGDIFQEDLDHHIRVSLPSFFGVLGRAMEMEGMGGQHVALYEHDFARNKVDDKVKWEMEAGRLVG